MSKLVLDQFNRIRKWTVKAVEDLSEEVVDIQPDGFNNTIRWHIGHIITETEYFMFELPCNPVQIPLRYNEFFGPGTKPSKWDGEVPLLSELVATLKDQLTRVNEMSPEDFNKPLAVNTHGYTIAAEAAAFSVIHEAIHVGHIESMKRILVVSAI